MTWRPIIKSPPLTDPVCVHKYRLHNQANPREKWEMHYLLMWTCWLSSITPHFWKLWHMKSWGLYTFHFETKILQQREDEFIVVSLEKGPRKISCVGGENLHHNMGMSSTWFHHLTKIWITWGFLVLIMVRCMHYVPPKQLDLWSSRWGESWNPFNVCSSQVLLRSLIFMRILVTIKLVHVCTSCKGWQQIANEVP